MKYRLLKLLASRPARPFSRDDILNALRDGDADLHTRAVDVLVSRLRQKLRPSDRSAPAIWSTALRSLGATSSALAGSVNAMADDTRDMLEAKR